MNHTQNVQFWHKNFRTKQQTLTIVLSHSHTRRDNKRKICYASIVVLETRLIKIAFSVFEHLPTNNAKRREETTTDTKQPVINKFLAVTRTSLVVVKTKANTP